MCASLCRIRARHAALCVQVLTSFVFPLPAENKFVSTGFAEEISKAANGKYYYLPQASGESMHDGWAACICTSA